MSRASEHSHGERSQRYGLHQEHVLSEEVDELRRLLQESEHALGRMMFERDHARSMAAHYEEIVASLSGAEHGTAWLDVL